jgi:hypothetical protein
MEEVTIPIAIDPFALATAAGIPEGTNWWFVTADTEYVAQVPEEYASALRDLIEYAS